MCPTKKQRGRRPKKVNSQVNEEAEYVETQTEHQLEDKQLVQDA